MATESHLTRVQADQLQGQANLYTPASSILELRSVSCAYDPADRRSVIFRFRREKAKFSVCSDRQAVARPPSCGPSRASNRCGPGRFFYRADASPLPLK